MYHITSHHVILTCAILDCNIFSQIETSHIVWYYIISHHIILFILCYLILCMLCSFSILWSMTLYIMFQLLVQDIISYENSKCNITLNPVVWYFIVPYHTIWNHISYQGMLYHSIFYWFKTCCRLKINISSNHISFIKKMNYFSSCKLPILYS